MGQKRPKKLNYLVNCSCFGHLIGHIMSQIVHALERTFFRTKVTTIFNFTNDIIRSTFFCNHGNQAIVDENSGSGHQNFGNIFVVNPKGVFGTFLLVLIISDNFDGGTYFMKKKNNMKLFHDD